MPWIGDADGGPLRLVDVDGRTSRAPTGPGEVAMDVETARDEGFRVGDRVDVLSAGPKETFEIVGLFTLGDSGEVGPLQFAAFDLPTAQRVMAAPDLLDAIYVRRRAGRLDRRAPSLGRGRGRRTIRGHDGGSGRPAER